MPSKTKAFQTFGCVNRRLDSVYRRQYGPPGFFGWRGVFNGPERGFGVGVMTDMNDGTSNSRPNGGESRNPPPPQDAMLSARLQRLGRKLTDVRKARDLVNQDRDGNENGSQSRAARASAMARGFRLSSELIAGVLVGFVIGWGIDRWLSTTPLAIIVFVLLGFAAGVLNLMRAAGVQQANGADRDHP